MTRTAFSLAALVGLTLAIFRLAAPPPPVRVTFLSATNNGTLRMGVFRFENDLNEPVTTEWGFYQRKSESGVEPQMGNYGVQMTDTLRDFPGGASNTFQIYIPTNGGPYRLVLSCLPNSKRNLSPSQKRWFAWESHLPLPGNAHRRMPDSLMIKSEYFGVQLPAAPSKP